MKDKGADAAATWAAQILTGSAEVVDVDIEYQVPEDAEEALRRGRIKQSVSVTANAISNVFNEAVRAAILEHFAAGNPIHVVLHGWIVEVRPVKKIED